MTLSDLIAVMRDGKLVQFGPTKRDLPQAARPVRGDVRGQAQDEPRRRARSSAATATSTSSRAGAPGRTSGTPARSGCARASSSGSRWASGPRTSGSTLNGGAPNPPRTFQATVQLLEPIGSDTFVELAAGDATIVARVAPDCRRPARPDRHRRDAARPRPPVRARTRRAHHQLIAAAPPAPASRPTPLIAHEGARHAMSPSLIDRLDPRDFETVAKLVLPAPIYGWIALGLRRRAVARRQRGRVPALAAERRASSSTSATSTSRPRSAARSSTSRSWSRRWASRRPRTPTGELGTAAGVAATGALFVEAVNADDLDGGRPRAHPELPCWLQLYNWNDRDALAAIIRARRGGRLLGHRAAGEHRAGVSHTPPRVGYRLPAGVSFAHFDSSPASTRADRGIHRVDGQAARRCRSSPRASSAAMTRSRAVNAGAKGIMVSNHGGRQLSHEISTLDALPGVVAGGRHQGRGHPRRRRAPPVGRPDRAGARCERRDHRPARRRGASRSAAARA